MQTELFEKQITIPSKSGGLKPEYRCRNCVYMIVHKYNKKYKYCFKQKSNRTTYVYKKIKAMDNICQHFKIKII